jgi:eukaryotic-like serine/threonine-protein kinase
MSAGKFLGRYELIEQLGQGGMGEVWLARLTGAAGFEKPALLKSVLPRLAGDAQFVERFQHEGKVLVHLQHANIAQVLDMGEAEGTLYIALEYVMGVDVSRLHDAVFRNGGEIPVPLALWICQQAAEGLAYAHGKTAPDGTPLQIVHRDVSPHNLMVSYDGEVKVIDFGIARSTARAAQTQPQTVLGKIGYMAPEQARGEEVDARADQYSLGIVLWELLTSQPFVRPGSVGEMMGSMANPQPRPVRQHRADVPAEVDEVLQRALAADPQKRFARMADFSAALMQELARRYRMPNREELSGYVREKCAEQWKAHQELLQRVTGSQRAATPAAAARPPRPRTSPGAETKASSGVKAPVVAAAAAPAKPVQADIETRISRPPPKPEVVKAPHAPMDPDPTPLAPPPSSTRVMERKADALSTDESLAAVHASRTPMLIIAGVAVVLSALLYWMVSKQPMAVDTPHGPVPAPAQAPDAAVADARPAPPKPPPLPLVLQGKANFKMSPEALYELKNTGSFNWTNCVAFFPGKKRGAFPSLPSGGAFELIERKLEPEDGAPELDKRVNLRCKQGSATFAVVGM